MMMMMMLKICPVLKNDMRAQKGIDDATLSSVHLALLAKNRSFISVTENSYKMEAGYNTSITYGFSTMLSL